MARTDYQFTLYNPIVEMETKGFVDLEYMETYKKNFYVTNIPIGMEYRPDLIAKQFLGDAKLAWLIYYINNYTNGIKDFKPGRKIRIPNL
jgi:hypothetical protein